jgi:2-polyprenyl-3-methyl-5-hydroxy-6-metoxy-1,4-benzoquinol methylase
MDPAYAANEGYEYDYAKLLAEHGPGSPRAVGWGNHEWQVTRFKVLCSYVPIVSSLIDVGCGLGDLSLYTDALSYLGVDAEPALIAEAKTRHPSCTFAVCDVRSDDWSRLGDADWVVASGVLPHLKFDELRPFLNRLWSKAKDGLAVNFHSSWEPVRIDPGVSYFDPADVLKIGRSLTRNVMLRADYLPHDATLVMRRGYDAP